MEATSYGVEMAWKDIELDYTPLWNPNEHRYIGWESTENPITVTNTTENGAPIRVTLTFVPTGETAVKFSPCKDDPNPNGFTFLDGQVIFELPSMAEATVCLSLAGEPSGWALDEKKQIGTIKTEFTPLVAPQPIIAEELPIAEELTEKPAESSQPAPAEPSLPGTLPVQPSQPEPPAEAEQLPPPTAEGPSPETETEKQEQEQESTLDAMPPPEQKPKEETQTAPPTVSGAPPQEEPQ